MKRAKRGKASFNYRIKYKVKLGWKLNPDRCKLRMQVWDKDLIGFNDVMAEAEYDLLDVFKRAFKKRNSKEPLVTLYDGWKNGKPRRTASTPPDAEGGATENDVVMEAPRESDAAEEGAHGDVAANTASAASADDVDVQVQVECDDTEKQGLLPSDDPSSLSDALGETEAQEGEAGVDMGSSAGGETTEAAPAEAAGGDDGADAEGGSTGSANDSADGVATDKKSPRTGSEEKAAIKAFKSATGWSEAPVDGSGWRKMTRVVSKRSKKNIATKEQRKR